MRIFKNLKIAQKLILCFLLYRKQLAETAVDNILAKKYIEKIR